MFSRTSSYFSLIPFIASLIPLALISPTVQSQGEEQISHKFTLGSYFSKGEYGGVEETSINIFQYLTNLPNFPGFYRLRHRILG